MHGTAKVNGLVKLRQRIDQGLTKEFLVDDSAHLMLTKTLPQTEVFYCVRNFFLFFFFLGCEAFSCSVIGLRRSISHMSQSLLISQIVEYFVMKRGDPTEALRQN